jgi:hypothetical protein
LGAWGRLNIVWKVLAVLATLGIAVAFVLLLVALFRAEPERKLRVGDTAASGPFDFTFRKIACHKRRKDLPEWIEEIPFPDQRRVVLRRLFESATVRTKAGLCCCLRTVARPASGYTLGMRSIRRCLRRQFSLGPCFQTKKSH